MLENIYTTKMSSNKKTLQNRFTKIRSKSGRLSKMMALVMSAAIAAAMLCATVVMAAVGPDGLEHFYRNEIYFRDGVQFSVNVAGKNVPDWVSEDIAGADGNINITVTRYQTRDLYGQVNNDHLISLTGTNGTVKLAASAWSMLAETANNDLYHDEINPEIRKYKYDSYMNFIEFNNIGYTGHENSPIASLADKKESKFRFIEVYFAFDENKKLQKAYVSLLNADKNDNATDERFDIVQANGSLSYIGSFETDYVIDVTDENRYHNYYFTMYEDNYQNKTADGVDIGVLSSGVDEIIVKTDVNLPDADKIVIEVYNEEGKGVAGNSRPYTFEKQYTLTPEKEYRVFVVSETGESQETEFDVPENHFAAGEKYRVCVVVMDKDYAVLYRWQEYVTIK